MTTTSPRLKFEITSENYETAVQASSGGCLFADAIKRRYPHLSKIEVDAATTRVTDRKRGERYVYLTPRAIGEFLCAFDQGWREESLPKTFIIKQPVRIMPIERSASMRMKTIERRAARLAKLEGKEQSGETLTSTEKASLHRLRNPKPAPERPIGPPPPTDGGGDGRNLVVRGGRHPSAITNPNLLAGHNRVFGLKSSQPSEVFKRAVGAAVEQVSEGDKAKIKKLREQIKALKAK